MATCKDCLYVDVCMLYLDSVYKKNGLDASNFENLREIECDDCVHFKDRSRFVELPCKVGDMFYEPKRHQITEYQITRIVLTEFGLHFGIILKKGLSFRSIITPYDIGKVVFTTREEAEQALNKIGDVNA